MRRLPDEAFPHFQADQAWLSARNACPARTRPSAPGSVYGITLARILQVNSSMPLPCPEDNSGRAGPARTRIRAEALASPAPLITQPPVIAKQRQGPPSASSPRGTPGACIIHLARTRHEPVGARIEPAPKRKSPCKPSRPRRHRRGPDPLQRHPRPSRPGNVPRGEPTGPRFTPCMKASPSAFACLRDP